MDEEEERAGVGMIGDSSNSPSIGAEISPSRVVVVVGGADDVEMVVAYDRLGPAIEQGLTIEIGRVEEVLDRRV
jgi:hypothetical protein